MSIYVIGDRDTVLGMKLVGAEGTVPGNASEALRSLEQALERSDLKLVFITRDWAGQMRERIDRLKMTSLRPVVMEIPGKGLQPQGEPLSELVRKAVGVRV